MYCHHQGRYIPVFASAVYDRNAELVAAGMTPINLTSVMIGTSPNLGQIGLFNLTRTLGNGCTDFIGMSYSFYDVQCMDYGFPAVTGIS